MLALPRAYALDVSIAAHVFGRHPGYSVAICGDPAPARRPEADATAARAEEEAAARHLAAQLGPTRPLADAARAGIVVVPGYDDPERPVPEAVSTVLRAAVAQGARVVAVCTGVFALAASGALDGRRATTHWRYSDRLRALRPAVDVVENRLLVEDGPFVTSAGAGAGIDACLHVVRADFGSSAADGVAKDVVAPALRHAEEPQYSEVPAPDRASLRATREWAIAHVAEPLTVQRMADHSLLSRRTFVRRFTRETGLPPMRWVALQRLYHARRLLETSDWPVERVAGAAGFGSAAHFRACFRRELGVTPSAYRREFTEAEGALAGTDPTA
ncbi:Transcriptional regulator GlxA family, contains an amidase domain and an AraC-type DNA-binding HTH domain [Streptomyces zhaozhouensis]|uniref:Transcriptional regulator GlxA family, contains an amidase domain and an AraC-type DNA-binding HTH domain n=1 Tax=Streptomyces zhaozhouensis TaxID=1300267 RepID=A0A286E0I5_9ACTN|nr:Transcriptional regulator GlxA family, contains an amidase domain and an AraC-type DNA-binding HTH domain [Streptomyces zhaozhouensis]